MSKKRPTYSNEFKIDAASLVLDKGYSYPEACAAVNVGATALRSWVRQLDLERQGQTPKNKALTAEHQEVQALTARVKQLEWENQILKKATALVMSDSIKR
jgi:transposase